MLLEVLFKALSPVTAEGAAGAVVEPEPSLEFSEKKSTV